MLTHVKMAAQSKFLYTILLKRPSFMKLEFPEAFLKAVDENSKKVAEKLTENFVVHVTGPPGTGKTFGVASVLKELANVADFLIHFDETRNNQKMTIYRLSDGKVVDTVPKGANLRVLLTNCAKSSGIAINGKNNSFKLSFNKRIVPALFKKKENKVILSSINAQMTEWFLSKTKSQIAENQKVIETMTKQNSLRIKKIKGLLRSADSDLKKDLLSEMKELQSVPKLNFLEILEEMIMVNTTNVLQHLTLCQYLVIVMSRKNNSLAKAMCGMHVGVASSFLQRQFSHFLGVSFQGFKEDKRMPNGIKVESVDPTLFDLLPGYMCTEKGMTKYCLGEIPTEKTSKKGIRKCLILKDEENIPHPLHVTTDKNMILLTVTKLVTLNGARALFGKGSDGEWYHITVETTPFTEAAVFHERYSIIKAVLNSEKKFLESNNLEELSKKLMYAEASGSQFEN